MDRVFYSSSVHDEREIEAVVEVLRSGPQGLWPGRRVAAMERQVAALFGKTAGVMVNSGSSALYLAVELLGLAPGAEVVTCGLTFSTDVAPIVRAGLVPVFVDVETDTFCVDVARIEEMITPSTGAMLIPNLIGNAPDWDVIRAIADRHACPRSRTRATPSGRSCAARPTGDAFDHDGDQLRQLAHHDRAAATAGCCCVDSDDVRVTGRSCCAAGGAVQSSSSSDRSAANATSGKTSTASEYDNQFIFDELAWNFEPSEMGAAFGLEQLKKLDAKPGPPPAHLRPLHRVLLGHQRPLRAARARLARARDGVAGLPALIISETAGFGRPDLQRFLDSHGIDTRTIWTGNVARQPMLRGQSGGAFPTTVFPNADAVMERGVLLPLSHAIDDETLEFVIEQVDAFLAAPHG